MNNDKLESEVIGFLCSLAVSARGLVDEPRMYGPMRLMQVAERLINLAEDCGIRHELLAEVAERIEEQGFEDLGEEFIRFMDDLIALLATWVKQSCATPENNRVGD
jgi:hypothetical protein